MTTDGGPKIMTKKGGVPRPAPKTPPRPGQRTAGGYGNGKVSTTAPFWKDKGWLG